jgi:hypothetical protein
MTINKYYLIVLMSINDYKYILFDTSIMTINKYYFIFVNHYK